MIEKLQKYNTRILESSNPRALSHVINKLAFCNFYFNQLFPRFRVKSGMTEKGLIQRSPLETTELGSEYIGEG